MENVIKKDIGNYIVYSDGKIFSKHIKRFMKPSISNYSGYLNTKINGRSITVHRLVAETFIPNPLNLDEVDHISSEKSNNNVDNLQWISKTNNIKKAWNDNIMSIQKGSKNGMSKLSEEQVKEIKYTHKHLKQKDLAEMYNCHRTTIAHIRAGKLWAQI
jgi:uncharacterized protein (UPF0248 family)